MPNKITWTHVDRVSRQILENRGMLAVGATDAEVTCSLIAYLERSLTLKEEAFQGRMSEIDRLRHQVEQLSRVVPKSKTRQRLAALEEAVAELRHRLGDDL